jgi:hypothetical protein
MVGGGQDNVASGESAVVGGGHKNIAQGAALISYTPRCAILGGSEMHVNSLAGLVNQQLRHTHAP